MKPLAMNGKFNTHNVRAYSPKVHPTDFTYDINASHGKVTVWEGLCGNGIILGPYFFERNVKG